MQPWKNYWVVGFGFFVVLLGFFLPLTKCLLFISSSWCPVEREAAAHQCCESGRSSVSLPMQITAWRVLWLPAFIPGKHCLFQRSGSLNVGSDLFWFNKVVSNVTNSSVTTAPVSTTQRREKEPKTLSRVWEENKDGEIAKGELRVWIAGYERSVSFQGTAELSLVLISE